MGSNRLGRLPDSKPWRIVIGHIADGASVAVVAGATSRAAVNGLERGQWDRGVAHVIFLLARTALAARQTRFSQALAQLEIIVPDEPTLFDLTSGFTAALQTWHADNPGIRTDLGEMATLAGAESIAACVGNRAVGLFSTGAEVQAAVRDLSTLNGFASLGHDYHTRFIRRFLLYHLGRELSQHVGGCGRFADPSAHTAFIADLETHCREAAVIVREIVGDWYHKAKFETGISERTAKGFAARSLEKLSGELARRGARGG